MKHELLTLGALVGALSLGCEKHPVPSIRVVDVGPTGGGGLVSADDGGVDFDVGLAPDAGFVLDAGSPQDRCGPISQAEMVQKVYNWAGLTYCGEGSWWINHDQYCSDSNPANWPEGVLCQRRGLQHELQPQNPLGNCRQDYVVSQGRFANALAALLDLEANQRRLGQLPADQPTFSNIGRGSSIQAAVNAGYLLPEDAEDDGRFLAQKPADRCWVDQVLGRRNAGANSVRVEFVATLPSGDTVEQLDYEFRSASQWPDGQWSLGSLSISSGRTQDFRRRLKLYDPDDFVLITFPSFDGYQVGAVQIDGFSDEELLEIDCPGAGVNCFAVPAEGSSDLGVRVRLRPGTLTRVSVQFAR